MVLPPVKPACVRRAPQVTNACTVTSIMRHFSNTHNRGWLPVITQVQTFGSGLLFPFVKSCVTYTYVAKLFLYEVCLLACLCGH